MPSVEREARHSDWLGSARRHPVITSVLLGCTIGGALAGFVYLDADWSAFRRIAAGAVGGAGAALLVTATKMLG
jgi:hypothetical protein